MFNHKNINCRVFFLWIVLPFVFKYEDEAWNILRVYLRFKHGGEQLFELKRYA